MPRLRQPENLKTGAMLIVMGLIAVCGCTWAWYHWQDRFWIALKGPTEITPAALARIDDPSQLPSPWMKMTFEKGYDLDLAVTEDRIGDDLVEHKYLLIQIADRWLIATVKDDFQGNQLVGELYHSNDKLNNEAFVKIYNEHQDLHQGRLFPFEFHTAKDFGENWRLLPVALGLCGVFGLIFGFGGLHCTYTAFCEPKAAATEVEDPAITATNIAIARIMRDAGGKST